MEIEQLLKQYQTETIQSLQALPLEEMTLASVALVQTYLGSGTVYGCANGGPAGTISHALMDMSTHPFVSEDKSKPLPPGIPGLRTVDLGASGAMLTGLANDLGYDQIFAQQLRNYGVKKDDLVIGLTGSGTSGNVINAFEVARDAGAKTIAIVGGRKNGGTAKDLADHCIIIPGEGSKFPGQTGGNDFNLTYEDLSLHVLHAMTGILKGSIAEKYLRR